MPTIYCRHIRPSGRRCQSPALRNRPFCHFHEAANARLRALHPPYDGTANIDVLPDCDKIRREPILTEYFSTTRSPIELDFPSIEDAESIQLSLSMVLTALGQNRIDLRRAAAMLYNLQVATSALRHLNPEGRHVVTDPVRDQAGNLIAPDEDPEEVLEIEELMDSMEAERNARIAEGEDPDDLDEEELEEDNAWCKS